MAQGTVKWFNGEKGFGFIAVDGGGADVFVHYSAIESTGYRSLEEGQRVEFATSQGPKDPKRTTFGLSNSKPQELRSVGHSPALLFMRLRCEDGPKRAGTLSTHVSKVREDLLEM